MMFASMASLGACVRPAGGPPGELAGLWARSAAACEAGSGLVFGRDSVDLIIDSETRPILIAPIYRAERRLGGLRVTIRHRLGKKADHQYGALVVEQGKDGWLRLVNRHTQDLRTGSMVVRFADRDELSTLFDVGRCAD